MEKGTVPMDSLVGTIDSLLDDIQKNIYAKALAFRDSNVEKCDSWDEFKEKIGTGKFLLCHWDGTAETEQAIKDAIWDSQIPNDHAAARAFMLEKAREMGLEPVGDA